MPKIILLLLLAAMNTAAFGQRLISGRVVAQGSNAPLPQVTVRVEGQPASTSTTDNAGRFSLKLPAAAPNATLTFSHVGYQPVSVPIDRLTADVVLPEQRYQIGEVQVSYVQLRKLLLKTWRIAPSSLDAAAQETIKRVQATDPKRAEVLTGNPEAVRKVMEMARFDFRDNGVIKTRILIASNKMRWQIDEETRTLSIVDDEGGVRKIDVVELTDNRLVLKRQDAAAPELAYEPAD